MFTYVNEFFGSIFILFNIKIEPLNFKITFVRDLYRFGERIVGTLSMYAT